MYRYTTPALFSTLDPFLEWRIKGDADKAVYLTFDDGPHPVITPWVLELLAQHEIKATFFCVGENVRKYPEVYQQIIREGHAVGNHTQHHLNGWNHPLETYLDDIAHASQYIDSKLFRPPYGRIGPLQALRLKKLGYRIMMWSLLSRDFEANLKKEAALNELVKNTESGSIIVFHDSEKAESNLRFLLPLYVEGVVNKGFKMKCL